jgi:hypothetical protein
MAREPTDTAQLKLRIPERLRRQVEQTAKTSGRSLNGELIHLIEEGLARRETAAIINMAAKAGSEAAATRIMETMAPFLGRVARAMETLAPYTDRLASNVLPLLAPPSNMPPKDAAQAQRELVEAMGRAVEVMKEITLAGPAPPDRGPR